MATGYVHPQLHKEIVENLELQLRFWRLCAEEALGRWNALEDKLETIVETIGKVLSDGGTNLSLKSWHALESILNSETPAEADPVAEAAPPVQG